MNPRAGSSPATGTKADFQCITRNSPSKNDPKTAHDLVIRSTDAGAWPNQLIPRVLCARREPNYNEFEERNIWSLSNAFTEALKGNLVKLPKRTEVLYGLIDNHLELWGMAV